jgi:transcriptional regulator with XRE-family HTH domain
MLGRHLQQARKKAGLSQEELSFRAGLDRTYISHLERDLNSPSLNVLFRICAALGIRASTLIARVERAKEKGRRPHS